MSEAFEHPHQYELQAALDEGDFLRAIAIAEALLTEPEVELGPLHLLLGKLRLLVLQPETARAHFERVLTMPSETHDDTFALLSEAREQMAWLLKDEEPEAALALLKVRSEHPDMPAWAYHLGAQLLVECEQAYTAASHWLRQALAMNSASAEDLDDLKVQLALWTPNDAEHAHVIAQLDLAHLAAKNQLLPLVEASLERHPRHLLWLKDALHHLAETCPISLKVVVLRTLLELDTACDLAAQHQTPHTDEGRRCLQLHAELLTLLGKYEAARACVELAQAHAIKLSAALYIRLSLGLLREGQTQAAQVLAQAGLEAFPFTPELHILLGQSLLAAGKLELAQRLLSEATIEATPQQSELYQRHHDLRVLHHLTHHHPWRNVTSTEPVLEHVWLGQQHYLLTLKGQGSKPVMLKAYRQAPSDLSTRLERLAALSALASEYVKVPTPMTGEDGLYLQDSHTFKVWAYLAVDGHALPQRGMGPHLHVQQASALGREAARLSKCLRTLEVLPESDETWSLWGLIREGSLGLMHKAKALGIWWRAPEHFQQLTYQLDTLAKRLQPHLQGLNPQLCHGDFSWHNVLWESAESSRMTGIIDFDGMRTDVAFADALQASLHLAFDWGRRTSEGLPVRHLNLEIAFWESYQQAQGVMPAFETWADWAQVVRLRHYLQLLTHHRHLSPEVWQALGLGSVALALESAQEHISLLHRLSSPFHESILSNHK